jgi:MoaA/NifB/PqqE/SkfB family radical SAM enzyme
VINQRLFDWYKIDTEKNMSIKTRCPKPFDTLLIDKFGSCYLCECTSWLPQSVGNLQLQGIKDILYSDSAKILRESIADGSYRYCNDKQCSWLLYARTGEVWEKYLPVTEIKNIKLAVDDSCNLSCPSCRNKQIFVTSGTHFKARIKIVDKIITFLKNLNHTVLVHIGSDGDPFASLIYRYFMRESVDVKNLDFSFQTNGLLLKQMYNRTKKIWDRTKKIGVSIDGATKETYERLRLGGSYDKILENLAFLKKKKKEHGFKLYLHFIVQKDNYHEMMKIIELAEKYDVNSVCLNKIEDWNTYNNFREINITDAEHPEHGRYLEQFEKVKNKRNELKKENKSMLIETPTLQKNMYLIV